MTVQKLQGEVLEHAKQFITELHAAVFDGADYARSRYNLTIWRNQRRLDWPAKQVEMIKEKSDGKE